SARDASPRPSTTRTTRRANRTSCVPHSTGGPTVSLDQGIRTAASELLPRRAMLDRASTWAMPVALVALVIAATLAYPAFLDPGNLRNIVAQNAPVGIVAVAMTLVMVGGGFDLS